MTLTAAAAPVLPYVPTQGTPAQDADPTGLFAPQHAALLSRSAIDLGFARSEGVSSAHVKADLPESLRHLASLLPGLVFPLRDVHGNVVYQLRPDTPLGSKYLQETGSGTVMTVPASMVSRLATATYVLVVEGTKQTLAAANAAPDHVLVIGMQGCDGWRRDGAANGDLSLLVKGRHAVIALDGDIATNADVWTAGQMLSKNLRALGAKDVKFSPVVTSRKAGLDDWLAQLPAESRTEALSGLIDLAEARMPRKPRAKNKVTPRAMPICDWEAGVMVRLPGVEAMDPTKSAEPPTPTLNAALRIRTTTVVLDDLQTGAKQTVIHDVEVAVGRTGTPERVECVIKGIPNARLETPRDLTALLEQVPGGAGTHAAVIGGDQAAKEILSSVRLGGAQETRTEYQRLGHVMTGTGEHAFLLPGCAITAQGMTTETGGHVRGAIAEVCLPDPASISPEEARDAWKLALGIYDLMEDKALWVHTVGGMTFSSAGPRKPKSGLFVFSDPGAGKSTCMQLGLSHLGPHFVDASMVSLNSTGTFVGESGAGVHHLPLLIDDAYPRIGKAADAQVETLQRVARVSYDGPGAAKGKMKIGASGDWEASTPDRSSYYLMVSAENLPSSSNPSDVRSLLERMQTLYIRKGSLIVDEAKLHEAQDLGRSGVLAKVWALHLQNWLLRIERTIELYEDLGPDDRMRVSAELAEDIREDVAGWLRAKQPGMDPRLYEVAAAPIAGWLMYVGSAVMCGAITLADAKRYEAEALEIALRAFKRHTTEVLGATNARPHEVALDQLRAAIASGACYLEGQPEAVGYVERRPGATCLGKALVRVGGEECVAIIPEVAQAVTRAPSTAALNAVLKPVTLGQGGLATRLVRFRGSNIRMLAVPLSTWDLPDEVAGDGDARPVAMEASPEEEF